ncbi:MAG: hypothetical protein ABH883_05905 [Candidatus Omnitrophota bacterium]
MNNIIRYVSALYLSTLFISGCAYQPINFETFTGIGISDLEKARSTGKNKTVALSYDEAFNKVNSILESNDLTVFLVSKEKKYIVAIGFPRQTDTTRVGIFFTPIDTGNTEITLSSLSSTALAKAEKIIFNGIENTGK